MRSVSVWKHKMNQSLYFRIRYSQLIHPCTSLLSAGGRITVLTIVATACKQWAGLEKLTSHCCLQWYHNTVMRARAHMTATRPHPWDRHRSVNILFTWCCHLFWAAAVLYHSSSLGHPVMSAQMLTSSTVVIARLAFTGSKLWSLFLIDDMAIGIILGCLKWCRTTG